MRKVREVLRLRHALSLSYREISEALGVGKTSAGEIVRRAEVVGLTWPLPQLFDDGELERQLFTAPGGRPAADWAKLHEELKRRSMTLVVLWQEYRAEYPGGYGYGRFCDLYGEWRRSVSATMIAWSSATDCGSSCPRVKPLQLSQICRSKISSWARCGGQPAGW